MAKSTGFESASFRMETVPMDKIHFSKYSLRDADRNSVDYMQLRDAIAAAGLYQPILLREIDDPENKGEKAYGLVDGRQRFSCCQDLGFKEIPARVIDMDEADILAAQIIANRSRIETKPVEYTQQLHRMLTANPTLTKEELADQLHCKVEWLEQRLSLKDLHEKLGPLVDEGKIPLAHAFALAKLKPAEEQLGFVEHAQTMGIQEFSGNVSNRKKELQAAARAGRTPKEPGAAFVPVPHIRPMKEIKGQLEAPTLARQVVEKTEAKTPEQGFIAAIKWVLSVDPDGVIAQQQREADRKAANAADKAKKELERAEKRRQEAREAAEKVGALVPAGGVEEDEEEDEEEDD